MLLKSHLNPEGTFIVLQEAWKIAITLFPGTKNKSVNKIKFYII